MDSRNQILNQIFKILVPLRTSYKEEIDKITNDLLIGDDKSLEDFINKYYGNTNYSNEMVSLVVSLVNANLIPNSYLEEVNKKVQTNETPSYKQASVRPLNVKIINFNKIKDNILNKKTLDPTRFPISFITDEKKIEDTNNTEIEITNTNPNLTPVEITPDENTKPDIILPQEDMNTELPDFNKIGMVDAPNIPNVDVIEPTFEPDFEIPPIIIEREPQVAPITLETQNVMSKDDIINSLQEPEEVAKEEVVNPDLKHTTQLGQLLQFPLNNQTNTVDAKVAMPEVTPIVAPAPAPIEPEPVVNQEPITIPTPEVNTFESQVPTFQEQPVNNVVEPEPVTYQEPITLDLPTPDTTPLPDATYKVTETPKEEVDNSYSKEEINEEIAAKVREEVKKQVTEQIAKELAEQIRLEEKNNIVRIQNNYMNNASAFIQNLNDQSEEEIYMSLRYLNDLKYMSHCIAHLNIDTLERFYRFIEDKLNSPQSEFMDGFIEKRIRENLPPNLIEQIDGGMKKVA